MKFDKNSPIGVFDSGVGGLTVARELRRFMPNENILYFGDTARVPYGNKSAETIQRFSKEIMDFLGQHGVKVIVVACNTASSLALPYLKNKYNFPVLGVISPGAREAVRLSKNKRIAVIGTQATMNSGAYEKELKKIDQRVKVYSKPCGLFVPLVENRLYDRPFARDIAALYLKGFEKKNIDTLILGCTHYPILKNVIADVMKGTVLINSAIAVARMVKERLASEGFLQPANSRKGTIKCFVSDDPEGFKRTAHIFLKEKVSVKKVSL
ncbi:glutamate racemase [Candidatus Omnitrophus magneticus]|uniref:Glutamate racemase n=1 Tax=Candidatus Omnitrophus magneticus TaxID=1609969 RepID=A0A0F0CUJ7_9BACT|nr:glutamate racemase [Candidatus Omnitrophus magneticus]